MPSIGKLDQLPRTPPSDNQIDIKKSLRLPSFFYFIGQKRVLYSTNMRQNKGRKKLLKSGGVIFSNRR